MPAGAHHIHPTAVLPPESEGDEQVVKLGYIATVLTSGQPLQGFFQDRGQAVAFACAGRDANESRATSSTELQSSSRLPSVRSRSMGGSSRS